VVTNVANVMVIGIYMGIIFMTCAVVILTTIYSLKRGLGKTHPWKRKQYKLLKRPRMAELAESVPANEPIEEQAQPPDFRKDDNTLVFTYVPSKVSPVPVSPPAEEEQATIPPPDISNPEPEVVVTSENFHGIEPTMNEMVSANQVEQYSKSRQEEAAALKANDAIPEQATESALSHQEPTQVSETKPKQPEPVNAQLTQSEDVHGTEPIINKVTSLNQPVNAQSVQSEDVHGTEPIINKVTSLNQVVQSSKSRQEEAAELKANDTIPKQVYKSAASHQEPTRVSETKLKQPEPVNAGPAQSEPVHIETQPKKIPTKKAEDKKNK